MRIFVTGGAGFIGKHVVSSLLETNHQVTIFDNFSNSNKENTINYFKDKISIINGDITDFTQIYNSLTDSECVIHLAAKTDVNESIQKPIEYNNVNVTGTVNLLQACVKKDIKKIISASSAAVYGNPLQIPLEEKMKPNPLSPYGASKLSTEAYLQSFANSYDLNCISLRFFNIYGIDQTIQYAGVITKFIESIKKNSSLKINGNGKQTRDFISVHDVVKSIQNSILKIEGKRGNIYNIGTGKQTSVNELADIFSTILNKKLKIEHIEQQKGDIRDSYANIDLAKKELDFNTEINLKEGLTEILEAI
jgi:UDP-glucose 4-epimerase